MQNVLLRLIVFLALFFTMYQYRYKVMNYLLGFHLIRKFVVSFSMSMPNVREKLIQQAFR